MRDERFGGVVQRDELEILQNTPEINPESRKLLPDLVVSWISKQNKHLFVFFQVLTVSY